MALFLRVDFDFGIEGKLNFMLVLADLSIFIAHNGRKSSINHVSNHHCSIIVHIEADFNKELSVCPRFGHNHPKTEGVRP